MSQAFQKTVGDRDQRSYLPFRARPRPGMNFTLGALIGLRGTQHRKQNVKEWSGGSGCWTVWLAGSEGGTWLSSLPIYTK